MPIFLEAYQRPLGSDWVNQAVRARRAAEHAVGVEIDDARVSRLWFGPLLGQMLADAPRFAACYNSALRAYRRVFGLRNPQRPVPDLICDTDRCEAAAWAYQPGQPRRRLFVRRTHSALELLADETSMGKVDPTALRRWDALAEALADLGPWCIRPRALTLTLWARLMLADVFIHGIGGAGYDRITDGIMADYFQVTPPEIACVSATLHLATGDSELEQAGLVPSAADAANRVSDAHHQLRDLRYNPQRHLNASEHARLAATRSAAVAESLRLRDVDRRNHPARQRTFETIRAVNAALSAHLADQQRSLEDQAQSAGETARQRRIARRRDWFFALHPRKSLELLLEAMPGVRDFNR